MELASRSLTFDSVIDPATGKTIEVVFYLPKELASIPVSEFERLDSLLRSDLVWNINRQMCPYISCIRSGGPLINFDTSKE